jgi:hypothetical protein
MSNEEKQRIISNLPEDEVKTYEKFWVPGIDLELYINHSISSCICNASKHKYCIDYAKRKRMDDVMAGKFVSSVSASGSSSSSADVPVVSIPESLNSSNQLASFFTPSVKKPKKDGHIKKMFDKLEDEQKTFEEDTVCMLISCNLSLNLCDNPDFNAYIKKWTDRQAPSTSSATNTIVPRLSQTTDETFREPKTSSSQG